MAAGVGDDARGGRVALDRQLDDAAEREVVAERRAQQVDGGGAGGQGLQAAAVGAAADRAVLVDDRVADLAGGAADADVEPAAEHEARADAGRELEVDHVLDAVAGAPDVLGQRAEVRVVVDADGQVEAVAHRARGRDPDPAGQDRGRADRAGVGVDRARQAHPDAEDAGAVDARLGERGVDELGGGVEALVGAVVARQLPAHLGEDGMAEVRHSHRHVRLAEVDADGGAGAAVERDQDGRAATLRAGRGGVVDALGDEAVADEVADQGGDGGAGQTRAPSELGATGDPRDPECTEHPPAVSLAQGLERSGAFVTHLTRDLFTWRKGLSRDRTNSTLSAGCFAHTADEPPRHG